VHFIMRRFQCRRQLCMTVCVIQTNSAQSWWPLFWAISNAVNPDELSQLTRSMRLRSSSFSDSGLLWAAHRCRAVLPSFVRRHNSWLQTHTTHTTRLMQTVLQVLQVEPLNWRRQQQQSSLDGSSLLDAATDSHCKLHLIVVSLPLYCHVHLCSAYMLTKRKRVAPNFSKKLKHAAGALNHSRLSQLNIDYMQPLYN